MRGPREFNNYTLDIEAKVPEMPEWLVSEAAQEEWRRITSELGALDVLCNLDIASLAQYCVLYSELRDNPAEFSAARHTQLRLITAELGLSPASRRRLMKLKTSKANNPFANLDD